MIGNAFRIWQATASNTYVRPDGEPFDQPGAAQMIFSDLGTINVEASRGFSAYRWIRLDLIRLGVPAAEIAFMHDFKRSEAKQRLFGDVRAGKVRFLIGSSETMGTGVNAQLRLKALHHLDVPWLPSQIEQREGRIVRQGNAHDEVDIFAYATEGLLDATMWQNNERKARFIGMALSGDTSIRRLEDLGQANQFAMAKAIASGDQRLMQKAGLEADIARLERLRAAHVDDQHAVRRQLRDAERDIELSMRRIPAPCSRRFRRTRSGPISSRGGIAAGPISMGVRGSRILCRRHGGRGCTLLCCLVGGEADAHAHVVIPRRVLRKPPPSRTAGLGLADGRARCARSRSCPRNVLRRLFSAAFGFASPNKKAAAGRPPPHSGPPGAGRSPPASRPPSGRDGRDPENKE